MTSSVLDFVVFVINKYGTTFNMSIRDVYALFKRMQLIDGYIVKHYDVLHTLGEAYLMNDLHEIIELRSKAK